MEDMELEPLRREFGADISVEWLSLEEIFLELSR
jgi:hypothetical protein